MNRILWSAFWAAVIAFGLSANKSYGATDNVMFGQASWYKMGTRTANGERFNPNGLTAAHRTLKFGTKVRVTNLSNGKRVVVRINDRGPFIHNRIIDLAKGAATQIGLTQSGIAKVKIEILK